MGTPDKPSADRESFPSWMIALILVVVVIVGLLLGIVPWAVLSPEKAAQWGDSFGFVNALLSAAAFAGVLVTLWMQRSELALQREEMKLTRQELKTTREEHRRTAEAQEKSVNQLFLAAYMNALESLRQLSQWRMTADPARSNNAIFPVVEGLVVQSRVSQSLQILVRELEPDIRRLHPKLTIVGEEGSWVWQLERLLSVYLSLRAVLESHQARSDDSSAFAEAVNMVHVQVDELKKMKTYCGPHRHQEIDLVLNKFPDPKWLIGDVLTERVEAREARQRYFVDLNQARKELLKFTMSMCQD